MTNYTEKLRNFSSCDVADGLLNLYKFADGGCFSNLQRWSGEIKGTTVGTAYTVLFESDSDVIEEVNYIDFVTEGSIIVLGLSLEYQSSLAPFVKMEQGIYGGLMSTRAQYLGAAGTVAFGRIRDIDEHRALNYPVYSYGLSSCAPKMIVKPSAVNVPITILCSDGIRRTLEPGDYIVADKNGVVRIPTRLVDMDRLINYIEKSIEADELVAIDIKNGIPAKKAQTERRAILKQLL
ncbi:HDR014Cp [Eremothecium sinecaudum]|uniref:HDR014Cp n=1 Tax=Eremothecium sinecaudum TaxID=45286 RepID=A0A0X8HSQ1_9SACH|nr:HDR014Cp [Eremothecium sinecaudum]AMD20757.1 HDR014Cp [Eremothecium sinecaudum]